MESFDLVGTVTGIVLTYLLLSLICTALHELLELIFKMRARKLWDGVVAMLKGDAVAFYNHILIQGLRQQTAGVTDTVSTTTSRPAPKTLPSYIPSHTFAQVVMDLALGGQPLATGTRADSLGNTLTVPGSSFDFATRVASLPEGSQLKAILLPLATTAGQDLADVQRTVEGWYDAAMDRVAGAYKRYTLQVVFALGLIVAAVTNADSIALVNSISTSNGLRTALVHLADQVSVHPDAFNGGAKTLTTDLSTCPAPFTAVTCSEPARSLALLKSQGLPLGWETFPSSLGAWLWKVLGLIATGVALSMGAPFWFDVLNKIMVLRSTVKPAEKSPEEQSKS